MIAYDGEPFRGFAANDGVRTVMGDLSAAIARVLRVPARFTGAGRTDAGVHAWSQVMSGDIAADVDLADLMRRVNKLCAPSIAMRSAEWADPDFDARFSATWRSYRYEVWNDPAPNPLCHRRVWHVPYALDLDAMRQAAAELVGEHDFASFCRRPNPGPDMPAPSLIRIMYALDWVRIDGSPLLRFEVRGSAFCHQQVRSMVGTTVDVGRGRFAPDDLVGMLGAKRRDAAGAVAPPHGLTLWEVGYDGQRWDAV